MIVFILETENMEDNEREIYKQKLINELPEGSYTIKTDTITLHTGKLGYIEFLMSVRDKIYE
jgi:hypothetical protein